MHQLPTRSLQRSALLEAQRAQRQVRGEQVLGAELQWHGRHAAAKDDELAQLCRRHQHHFVEIVEEAAQFVRQITVTTKRPTAGLGHALALFQFEEVTAVIPMQNKRQRMKIKSSAARRKTVHKTSQQHTVRMFRCQIMPEHQDLRIRFFSSIVLFLATVSGHK